MVVVVGELECSRSATIRTSVEAQFPEDFDHPLAHTQARVDDSLHDDRVIPS